MKFDKKALMEAGQEIARVAFFAALSAVVAYGLRQFANMDQTEIVVVAGTILLKFVDKYVHDSKFIKFNGLTDTKIFFK